MQYTSLNQILPPVGNIRVLKVTEKQFDNIILLLGKKKKQEKIIGDQLIIAFKILIGIANCDRK